MRTIYAGLLGLATLLAADRAVGEPLVGSIGSAEGRDWCAAWLDLDQTRSFSRGDHLCISTFGGPEFLLRLKPDHASPASHEGIEGGVRRVPQDGSIIEVDLSREHPNVDQISLHACKSAFGLPFRPDNGKILLNSVSVETGKNSCHK